MKITFPPVMLQLLEEVVKPSPDIDILAKILAMDPVLAATVLTLANSPYYGSLQKITDLKRAATVLGAKEILKIALSILYQRHLQDACGDKKVDFFANWRLTNWSAIAAELLAERLCPKQANEAYLMALLKDISLLLLLCDNPESLEVIPYGQVITVSIPGQLEHEQRIWNTDHCRLSAQLLEEWHIPLSSQACIENHHDFDMVDSYDPFTQCIILATRWAEMELDASQNPTAVILFRATLQNRLQLTPEGFEELSSRCIQRFQSILATLGIAESQPNERFYQHSLKRMQEYHFLASEVAQASKGKEEVAAILARHLRWNWGLENWELALGVPEYRDWDLFVASGKAGLTSVKGSEGLAELPWTLEKAIRFPISANASTLGEFRVCAQGLPEKSSKELSLYFHFVSHAYENYALRQTVLELKAHTLDKLPVGVARLSPTGVTLEVNERLRQFLDIPGDGRGMDMGAALHESKNFSLGVQWTNFLSDPKTSSLHTIFCLWTGENHDQDVCMYLAADKLQWRGRDEILLFLEDVTLVSGWEFKALKQGEFLEKLIASMRDAVFTIDNAGTILFASPRVSHLQHKNIFQIAKPVGSYNGRWDPELLSGAPGPVEAVVSAGEDAGHTLELVFSPLPKAGKGLRHWLVVGRDITVVRRLEEKLKRLALIDGLTGLMNHYQFHSILDRETQRAKRTARGMGVLFFDLDNFKTINDTRGHQAGDDALRVVSRILKSRLRQGMDYPCRYGGDEFAVVVTEVDAPQLEHLAQRIMDSMQEYFKDQLGMSAGLAMLGANETPSALLRRADKASYMAKSLGGHRILWAQEPSAP